MIMKINKNKMVKMMGMIVAMQLSLFTLTSCEYREYADADYPENSVYQPLANKVLVIDEKTNSSKAEVPTPGDPSLFSVDKESGNLIIRLGVVQSGISFVSANVDLRADQSAVETAKADGTIDAEAVILQTGAYSMPSSLKITSASHPFDLQVSLNAIKAHPGKMLALAVTATSSNIAVSETMATQIILIDADYIIAQ